MRAPESAARRRKRSAAADSCTCAVAPGRDVRLIDLGQAKLPGEADMSLGHSFGTQNCRAPEHLGHLNVGRKADIYSLGIAMVEVTYPELLNGPFPDVRTVGERVVLAHMRAFWRTESRPGVPQCVEFLLPVRAAPCMRLRAGPCPRRRDAVRHAHAPCVALPAAFAHASVINFAP